MPRALDPAIGDVLKTFGYDAKAVWDCHGTWVVYHKILEQIAAKAGIRFDAPTVIEGNAVAKVAVICVTGRLGEKSEWSFGEATPANNKNAYPYAMAEKRAKDRVILKLIGLHGLAYSEEEADEFKGGNGNGGAPQPEQSPQIDEADEYVAKAVTVIEALGTEQALSTWWRNEQGKRKAAGISQAQCDELKAALVARRAAILPASEPVRPAPEAVAA